MGQRPVRGGRRFLKLAGMTAAVATNYARSTIRSWLLPEEEAERERAQAHEQSGKRIAETLGQLKGAVMKVGQMASIARDLLPKELGEALAILQREAPPMPFDVIASQVETELGSPPERLFERFDRVPFAAASIGQVHRARTDDGREVVVKVQYPGVDEAVDSDLAHLKVALFASGLARIKRQAVDAAFAELRARLHEELDYCNEADNVRLFADYYRDDAGVIVPDVVGERSSQRVLTLTFEAGDHLADLRDAGYSQEVRDRIGASVFTILADQLFNFQVLHADPNPANFAFRRDGTVVIYDFGCVKRLEPEIVEAYRDTIRAGLAEDYAAVEDGLCRLGARNTDGPPVTHEFYKTWRDIFAVPFVEEGPFDYGQAAIHVEVAKRIPRFLAKHVSSFQPPAELVFVDRVVVGHYGNLRLLGARGEFRALLDRHL